MLDQAVQDLERAAKDKDALNAKILLFGITGNRKPLTAHRIRMKQLESLIADCRAALQALTFRQEKSFVKIFTHANKVRDKVKSRLEEDARLKAKEAERVGILNGTLSKY